MANLPKTNLDLFKKTKIPETNKLFQLFFSPWDLYIIHLVLNLRKLNGFLLFYC